MDENRDPLTGLWNAKWAHEKLANLVGQSRQVAFLFIDIDLLSTFNCTFGHYDGDKELIRIAREIEDHSGANGLVCRFGGDEFGIILTETSLEKAREIAEEIRKSQKPVPIRTDGKVVDTMTFTIGISHFPTQVSDSNSLIYAADISQLKAKRGGRLPDGTNYMGRNRVMTFGDFIDEFPEQSAKHLNDDYPR